MKVKAISEHHGELSFKGRIFRCALGKSGVSSDKREGDHASPQGIYSLRCLYYRADKLAPPKTSLPVHKISRDAGWCDDPDHADYNRYVTLPFTASHETLWRADNLYDLVVVLGHNDDPPIPGRGSCIFMHVAKEGYGGTEGCVALEKADLIDILRLIGLESTLEILN